MPNLLRPYGATRIYRSGPCARKPRKVHFRIPRALAEPAGQWRPAMFLYAARRQSLIGLQRERNWDSAIRNALSYLMTDSV
jgi:hypothetical protein